MRTLLFVLILPILAFQAWGWDVSTPAPIVDQVKLLSPQENLALTQRIERLSDEDGIVLSVVILPTLDGDAIENVSIKVAEKFKLGNKKSGNGLLLLISTGDKKMRVEVGQGIEDIITDVHSNRLIRRVLAPTFAQGQFSQGISLFVTAIHNLKTTGKIEGTGETKELDSRYYVKRKAHVSPIQMKLSLGFILGLIILLPLLSYLSTVNRKSSAIVGALGFAACGGLAFGWASVLLVFIIFPLVGLVLGLVGPHNILFALMTNAIQGGGHYRGGGGGFGGSSGGSSWGSGGGGFSGGGSSGSW